MIGSMLNMVARLRALLPVGWFGDTTPVLDAVLSGFGACFAAIYTLIGFTISQSRIATATGGFLDLVCLDFFGSQLSRRLGEPDAALRGRIDNEMLRSRATRESVASALLELTGNPVSIFEPRRPADCGGYCAGGAGYGVAGGWGNLSLPFQFFVTVPRPSGGGIATVAGYGTGGPLVYASAGQIGQPISDADIYGAIPPLLPTATTAWCRLTDIQGC